MTETWKPLPVHLKDPPDPPDPPECENGHSCRRCFELDCSPATCPVHPDRAAWADSEAYAELRQRIKAAGRRVYPAQCEPEPIADQAGQCDPEDLGDDDD